MNSTQDPGRRSMTIQRHRVQASEESDETHYSFLQVKKGAVLLSRMESIAAYKKQRGSETEEQSETPVSANDMCALDEWPSHARRNRELQQNETDGHKKKGRGVLKGLKASKKRYANGSEKLTISFSGNLGGEVGMNYRTFVDEVVIMMKRRLPLIGVRRWADIHPTVHRQIVVDMMDRYALDDTLENEEKILKVAHERYRCWRSTLCCTYKAYKTDAARLANVPEDVQPEEWQWLIEYFGTDSKFKEISQKNSDNRKKRKTSHRAGSKSLSQLSFEKRNLETGEEPDCVALWEMTHKKSGTWANKESQDVYDKTCQAIQNKETEMHGPISSEERSNIFQATYKDTLKCKSSQPRGYGYMAKPPSGSERIRSQLQDQARAHEQAQKVNTHLIQQVGELQEQLQAERESTQDRIDSERVERENLEKMLDEERKSRLEFEQNMMAKLAQLSQQMGTQQTQANQTLTPNRRSNKENSNPNLQNGLSHKAGTAGALGTRTNNVIAPNTLMQAVKLNNRHFRAMDPKY